MYNFSELKTIVAQLVQKSGSSTVVSRCGDLINLSLLTLYNKYDYWHELKGTYNFTTVDGTALYYMPSDFEKPMRWYDITNDKPITILTEEEYFDGNIANVADANEADANYAYPKEVVGVKVQVATTGDTLQAKSSNAADTSVTIRVEGYLDSGLTIVGYEDITVTGTTATTATSPLTFYKITRFSKSADTTGYVTLENSSGTDLGILGQKERIARYKAYRLGKIPDDSTTNHRVLYKRKYKKLVDDNDYPFVECDDYLIYNSTSLLLEQLKEMTDRAIMFNRMAREALSGILLNQATQSGPSSQQKAKCSLLAAHRS